MATVTNDQEMRQVLEGLNLDRQRQAGALFVMDVVELCSDERLQRAVQVAVTGDASEDELEAAYKVANKVWLDKHARCGADCSWAEQASYFVARAAAACLAPQKKSFGAGPAWQAAMSSRMARTCMVAAEVDSGKSLSENDRQYAILNEFLGS